MSPGEQVLVNEWRVPFVLGGADFAVAGDLRWIPGPPWWLWLAAAAAVVTAPLLIARRTPAERRRPVLLRVGAATLTVVATLDIVHAIDDVLAVPATLAEDLSATAVSAAFIAIGLFAARRAWQAHDGAGITLLVGAGALMAGIGLTHLVVLTSSQIATVLPEQFVRAAIAANLALAVPAVAVAVLSGDARTPAYEDEPVPTQA